MDSALFIFRRDLRLEDNTALNAALGTAKTVVPCFILDPRQTRPHAFRSDNALRFMLESLADLDDQLGRCGTALRVYEGVAEEVVAGLVREHKAGAVFLNRDYTPFSLKRDAAIGTACTASGAALHSFDDAVLHAPDAVSRASGGAYTVFTPYARRAAQMTIPRPAPRARGRFAPAGPLAASLHGASIPPRVRQDRVAEGSRGIRCMAGGRTPFCAIADRLRSRSEQWELAMGGINRLRRAAVLQDFQSMAAAEAV